MKRTEKYLEKQGPIVTRCIKTAKLLINSGADVNVTGIDSHSPLQKAAMFGYLELIQPHIDKGANVNAEGTLAKTPFRVAEVNNYIDERIRERIINILSKAGGHR